jgi:hypothetical protein
LEQRISSLEQQKWVTKMLGYDYEIIYKKGKENLVADALSRKYEEEGSLISLPFIAVDWLNDLCKEWLADPKLTILFQQLQMAPNSYQGYTWKNEELCYKGHLYLKQQLAFKSRVLSELHSFPIVGHLGFHKTYERIKRLFFWEGVKDTRTYKGKVVESPSELQPLPILPTIWTYISMDFIVGLRKSCHNSVIMAVVDHLSKYAHFYAIQQPFKVSMVTQVFR